MINFKDDNIALYYVKEEYIKWLQEADSRVSKKGNRPFVGILVGKDNINYLIPLTTQIKSRIKRLCVDVKNTNGNAISQLLLNNMIPVDDECIDKIDIQNSKHKDFLNAQLQYLRKTNTLDEIKKKATFVFDNFKTASFLSEVCCDFFALEKRLDVWIEKLEDEMDCAIGEQAWKEFVASGKKGRPWEELIAEFENENGD